MRLSLVSLPLTDDDFTVPFFDCGAAHALGSIARTQCLGCYELVPVKSIAIWPFTVSST